MANSRIATSSITQGFPKSKSLLTGNDAIFAGSYESIETVTVGAGGVANFTFTSIPSTYTHLQLRGIVRSNQAGSGITTSTLQFNSDTGSNYTYRNLIGNGTGASAGSVAPATASVITNAPQLSATSNAFGFTIIDILDYTNTNKYKTIRALHGADLNGSGQIILSSGLWMNTSAITSITVNPASDAVQYTHFALYGIKG
jgi:hypothetical protein